MKKVALGIALISIIFFMITYNRLQQPTEKDVLKITEKWSESIEEVLFVREIEGKWLTLFRMQQAISIAELQQNWLGTWKFKNNVTLSSIEYPPVLENQIAWSASGKSENEAYYFGMVTDSEIHKITIETGKGIFEDVPFINYEGSRFFLKRAEGKLVMPVNISGYSQSGEFIYSSLKKINKESLIVRRW
ncbi:hypothetical protein [Solibacillus cecembensis]|uniref:hypothetical protein n=1 Tax=Solibacillus cecembensis TaxID=459347 RepID=UPI003D0307D3